ncbi:MAG: Phosphatidylserine decarboxylase proenzyme [candidate division TM6 bacterium GW2011_GWF2_30_66]|nr:MAG: Phosphatidylserine decarboxylase proenzyme [candidate division TM6 bacterium GW2011_GWF2_30_66]
MLYILKNNLLWTQGLPIVLVLAAVAIFSIIFFRPLLVLVLLFFIFSVYFFRNPERVCNEAINDQSVLVCPSDGKVIAVEYDKDNGFEGYTQKVSVFLSAFDVHVNWVPTSGLVQEVKYRTGTFKFAFLPKSSEFNERNDLLLLCTNGKTIKVRQIAGMVARRICCWVGDGDNLERGYKYGMIRFGSRMEIFLPETVKLSVGVGDRVYGGQTVLGRW